MTNPTKFFVYKTRTKTSFRYVIIDPVEVSKYDLYYALRKHLDDNVNNVLKIHVLN